MQQDVRGEPLHVFQDKKKPTTSSLADKQRSKVISDKDKQRAATRRASRLTTTQSAQKPRQTPINKPSTPAVPVQPKSIPLPVPIKPQETKTREELLAEWKKKKGLQSTKPSSIAKPAIPPSGTPVKHSFTKLIKLQIKNAKETSLGGSSNCIRIAKEQLSGMLEIDPFLLRTSEPPAIPKDIQHALDQNSTVSGMSEYWCTRAFIEQHIGDFHSAIIFLELAHFAKAQPLHPILDSLQALVKEIKTEVNLLRVGNQAKYSSRIPELQQVIETLRKFPLLSSVISEKLGNLHELLNNIKENPPAPKIPVAYSPIQIFQPRDISQVTREFSTLQIIDHPVLEITNLIQESFNQNEISEPTIPEAVLMNDEQEQTLSIESELVEGESSSDAEKIIHSTPEIESCVEEPCVMNISESSQSLEKISPESVDSSIDHEQCDFQSSSDLPLDEQSNPEPEALLPESDLLGTSADPENDSEDEIEISFSDSESDCDIAVNPQEEIRENENLENNLGPCTSFDYIEDDHPMIEVEEQDDDSSEILIELSSSEDEECLQDVDSTDFKLEITNDVTTTSVFTLALQEQSNQDQDQFSTPPQIRSPHTPEYSQPSHMEFAPALPQELLVSTPLLSSKPRPKKRSSIFQPCPSPHIRSSGPVRVKASPYHQKQLQQRATEDLLEHYRRDSVFFNTSINDMVNDLFADDELDLPVGNQDFSELSPIQISIPSKRPTTTPGRVTDSKTARAIVPSEVYTILEEQKSKSTKPEKPKDSAKGSVVVMTPIKTSVKEKSILNSDQKLTSVRRSARKHHDEFEDLSDEKRSELLEMCNYSYAPNQCIPQSNEPIKTLPSQPKTEEKPKKTKPKPVAKASTPAPSKENKKNFVPKPQTPALTSRKQTKGSSELGLITVEMPMMDKHLGETKTPVRRSARNINSTSKPKRK
jgi:hypothetical protein